MRKFFACSLAAIILLAGCKKENNTVQQYSEANNASESVSVPQVTLIKSVMIAGGYWRFVTDGADEGKMKWVEYAVPGTSVQAYGNPDPSDSSDVVEIKRQVVRTTDNEKRDFIHIQFEDHDYWVQDYSIVVNAVPGVIMGDSAYIFSKPSPDAMGDKKLDLGTVVGVLNNTEDSNSPYAAKFEKVNAYVNSRLMEGIYLSKDVVSTDSRDLLAMQIYEKLNAKASDGSFVLSDEVARDDLFDTAMTFDLPDAVHDMFLTLYAVEHQEEGIE